MTNRARFEQIFRDHYGAVSAFCLRRLADEDAADVVAEVFATTWARFDDIDRANVRAWLYAVARNKIAHRWRANGRRTRATARFLAQPAVAASPDPADLVTEADLLGTAARSLSPTDLELLQLVSWEGLDAHELAIVLGCTSGAAAVRVHRMRQRLEGNLDSLKPLQSGGNHTRYDPNHRTRLDNR